MLLVGVVQVVEQCKPAESHFLAGWLPAHVACKIILVALPFVCNTQM